jgi:hypothetical protein
MTWRKAHGRAADLGRLLVSETPPADELPDAQPGDPGRTGRDASGRFAPGNPWGRLAATAVRVTARGVLAELESQADPVWAKCRRWGRLGASRRIHELCILFGGDLSSEVCALVNDAWAARADARYLRARAAATGDTDLTRAASTHEASARQSGRDAWELASREAKARPNPAEAPFWEIDAPQSPPDSPAPPAMADDTSSDPDAPGGQL